MCKEICFFTNSQFSNLQGQHQETAPQILTCNLISIAHCTGHKSNKHLHTKLDVSTDTVSRFIRKINIKCQSSKRVLLYKILKMITTNDNNRIYFQIPPFRFLYAVYAQSDDQKFRIWYYLTGT